MKLPFKESALRRLPWEVGRGFGSGRASGRVCRAQAARSVRDRPTREEVHICYLRLQLPQGCCLIEAVLYSSSGVCDSEKDKY